ncbi:MAG: hypothetical protein M0008_14710 [Actinomycetota bacterium]|nr:hypothetical protein [Actinomycetota bacterium]
MNATTKVLQGMPGFPKRVAYAVAEIATVGQGWSRCFNGEYVRFGLRWARYYPEHYFPEKQAFLHEECRSGTIALDLGAHIGLYTALIHAMSTCMGKSSPSSPRRRPDAFSSERSG